MFDINEAIDGADKGILELPIIGALIGNPISCSIVLVILIMILINIMDVEKSKVKFGIVLGILISSVLSAYYYAITNGTKNTFTNEVITGAGTSIGNNFMYNENTTDLLTPVTL